jgi:uncharacterized protein (TIGR02466 family)
MPIDAWFPTFIYNEPLIPKDATRFNAELADECYRIRDYDGPGRKWCETNYPGGYTSYSSMNELHRFSSTFEQLEQRIRRHVKLFATHLDADLRGGSLEMVDCWVNIMPNRVMHGSHIHPLSFISGTYYVKTPPGASQIKFEDPRLAAFMAAPPRKAKHRPESRQHVGYQPVAGNVILFESWLRHEVAANAADDDRISISFNYAWR